MNKTFKKISDLAGFKEICDNLQLSKLTVEKIKNIRDLQKLNANLDDHSLTYIESTKLLDRYSIPKKLWFLYQKGAH